MRVSRFGMLVASPAALLFAAGIAFAQQGTGAGGSMGTGGSGTQGGTMQQPGMQHGGSAGAAGQQAGGMATSATIEQITQSPAQYFGKRVRFTSRVSQTIDPHFFTIAPTSGAGAGAGQGAGAGAAGSGQQTGASKLLVLIEAPVKKAPQGDTVTITGTVRPFVLTEVERDYDWFDNGWMKEADVDIESTTVPAIVADSVTTKDGTQLVQSGAKSGSAAGDAPKEPGSRMQQQPHSGGAGSGASGGSGSTGGTGGGSGSMR